MLDTVHNTVVMPWPAQVGTRKDCPECDGRGASRTFYDYARQQQQTEFCSTCDGRGYVNTPAITRSMVDEMIASIQRSMGGGQ